MTIPVTDARMQIEAAVKPLRALLDLTAVLDAAVEAENFLKTSADEIAQATAKRDALLLEADQNKAILAQLTAESAALTEKARHEASSIVSAARAQAAEVLKGLEAEVVAKRDAQAAVMDAAERRLVVIEGNIAAATEKLEATKAELLALGTAVAESQAVIARAEAISKVMKV